MMKRWMAMLLALIALVGAVPLTAFAQDTQTETGVDAGDVTVEGTNGLGDLLSEDIITYQEETEDSIAGGYAIVDLQVEGNTATVEYAVIEQARLVVSIYTEDGLQMLLSGNTLIEPDNTVATVTLEGTMPQYFMASAYMADIYDYSPLCEAYSTPMYTQDMQQLLASDVYDYDQELVLNLNEDSTTNFAVYQDSVILIERQGGVNTVTSIDDENAVYVIENADATITGLQPGDVFSYAYAEDEYLIAKVATITADGTTVTITGDDVELEEVFSHMKLEHSGDTTDAQVDTSTLEEGVSYEGLTQDEVQTFVFEGDSSKKYSFTYGVDTKVSGSVGVLDGEVKVSGTINLSIEFKLSYYVALKRQYIKFQTDVKFGTKLTVSGEAALSLPLGIYFIPLGCIGVGFEPEFQAKLSGELSTSVTASFTIGFKFENKAFTNISTAPIIEAELSAEGTFFLGVDMAPTLLVAGGRALDAKLEMPIGVEVKAAYSQKMTSAEPNTDCIHGCENCIESTIYFKAEFTAKLKLLKSKRLTFSYTFTPVNIKIGDMYWSLDYDDFGWGECPYKMYRVSMQILDTQSRRLPDAELDAVCVADNTTEELGTTNEKGVWVGYLLPDTYEILITADGKETKHTVEVEEACKLYLIHADVSEADKLLGNLNPGTILEGGDQEIAGSCGENVTYELFPTGLLLIEGTGDMYDYNTTTHSETPWTEYMDSITSIVIDDGVTRVGSYAFYELSAVQSVVIGNSVTSIGDSAFSYMSALTDVTFPDSLTTIEDYAFENCDALTEVSLPDGLVEIYSYAFARCNNLTELVIPASVNQISICIASGSAVTAITVHEDNAYFTSVDGVLFNKDMTRLESAPGGISGAYSVPDGVTLINQAAFYNCTGLTAVTIPESVENIGPSAFMYCSKLKQIYFLGDAPQTMSSSMFENIVATAYYPADNTTWTADVMQNYTGTITWVSYTLDENGDPIIESTATVQVAAEEEEIAEDNGGISTFGIWGGEYETEETPDYDLKTAVFSGLVPGEQYLMVAVASIDTDDLLAADNLLYIAQGAAAEDGTLTVTYVQRVETDLAYVFACGASNKNLKDATITFPVMLASNEAQTVEPTVVYEGKTLKEGQDYTIAGIADYTAAGTYTCYIRGIYNYTGLVKCQYTVGQLPVTGTCGDGLTWTLDENGTLTISGSGTMEDTVPWSYYGEIIQAVVINKGVESVSDQAFSGCTNLEKINFLGNAPAIGENAFAGVAATAEYPVYDPSWTEEMQQNYGGTITWTGVEYPCEHANTTQQNVADPSCTATGYTGDTVCQDCYKTVTYGTVIPANGHNYVDGYCSACGEEKPIIILASGACGAGLSWTLSDAGVLSIGGIGDMKDYCTVLAGTGGLAPGYEAPWYALREQITSVEIGEGVTSIGTYAFKDCTSLTEVTVPDNVKTIGEGAFSGCSSLESITIPFVGGSIKQPTDTYQYPFGYIFGTYSYSGATGVTQHYYSYSTTYSSYAKYYLPTSLKNVTVTGGHILYGAFYACAGLSSVTLCEGVTGIESSAFSGCAGLTAVTIPDGVTKIGKSAFYNCKVLTEVVIPDSVTVIDDLAFWNCYKLTKVTLGSGVTQINIGAFENCVKLESIIIPQSVVSIGEEAFSYCTAMEEIYFQGDAPAFGTKAFYYATTKAYYPADNTTWTEEVMGQYGGDVTWIPNPCPHTATVLENVVAATCTAEGYTGDEICQLCGEVALAGTVIDALGHRNTELKNATEATCATDGYTGDTYCMDCLQMVEEGTKIPATGHSYEAAVNAPTCTADGYTTYTCSTCGDTYTADTVLATGHSYADGTCTTCGAADPDYVELIGFAGMTMTLGNSLAANFVINTALLDGSGHYAVITKTYADGTEPVSVTIPQSQWQVYSGKLYYFTFTSVNAKEMTDEFTVIVYNAAGKQVSVTYTRTIEDYCYGLITKEEAKTSPDAERLALYTDILNYGAAAQDFFGYNLENLANARVTEQQQAYATQDVVTEDVRVKGEGYMGSTLSLKNEILMNFVFRNATADQAAYAVYTFRHHDGGEESVTVPAEEFQAYGTSGQYMIVTGMKIADCNQVITVTLHDAQGNILSTSADSVWSYASRNTAKHEVYTAVLKLADSAYKYFH